MSGRSTEVSEERAVRDRAGPEVELAGRDHEPRVREECHVAGVVVVGVRDDDGVDRRGVDTEAGQPIRHRSGHLGDRAVRPPAG